MSMTAKPPIYPANDSVHSQFDEWIAQHLASNAVVQMRLRGNILHVLVETPVPLHQAGAMTRLVDALLAEPPNNNIVVCTYPQVYQLYIYSRRQGEAKPDWTAPIYLNRLDKHQAQLQGQADQLLKIADAHAAHPKGLARADGEATTSSDDSTTAIVLSHLSLAQQGDPDAIAWYLSEVLSTLDVGVWVSVITKARFSVFGSGVKLPTAQIRC